MPATKEVKQYYYSEIERLSQRFATSWLCQLFGVSRSGYYKWKQRKGHLNRYQEAQRILDDYIESIAATIADMNEYINDLYGTSPADEGTVLPVYVDENGFYHIYYVAKYSQYKTPTSSLTINKTATGAAVPASATFTISGTTVDNEAYTTSFTYQDMTDGTKTITIPVGSYTVTESGADVSNYTLTSTVDYGEGATNAIVVANETAVVSITNTYTFNGGGGGGGGGDSGTIIIIPEPPVPLNPAPQPEPEEEIPEEEVPLVDVPKTGDASALWLALSVLSGTGLAGVSFLGRKKHEA